jgi:hypothetical protein
MSQKSNEVETESGGGKTMNLVAIMFALQPVCNSTHAVDALHSDQFAEQILKPIYHNGF